MGRGFFKVNKDYLNKETGAVFDLLSNAEELSELCLIGGTALTLHLNHRNSLDLDFTLFKENTTLPAFKIDQLVRRLIDEGHAANLITDPGLMQQHKINTGNNLLDFARDYVINGVKVTFFSGMKNKPTALYERLKELSVKHDGIQFSILSLDGLKISKSLVLDDRVKSRDLFDLMWLMKNNHLEIKTFFSVIDQYANNSDHEYYKAVLRGDISVDQDDEGLEPVNLAITVDEIYHYFSHIIDKYEQSLAKCFGRGQGRGQVLT